MKKYSLRWPTISVAHPDAPLSPLWKRLLWMASIWSGSIAVLLVIAMVLRWVLRT